MNTEICLASFTDRVVKQQRKIARAVLLAFGPQQNFGPKESYAYLNYSCIWNLTQRPFHSFENILPLYAGWYEALSLHESVDGCEGQLATYVPFDKKQPYVVKFFVENGEFNTKAFDATNATLDALLQGEKDSVYYGFYCLAMNPLQPRGEDFHVKFVEPLKMLYELLDQKKRIMSPAAEMDPKNLER